MTHCNTCNSENIIKELELKDYFLSQESFTIYKCNDCKLLFTYPVPRETDLSKYYDSPDYLSHVKEQKSIKNYIYQIIKRYNLARKYLLISKIKKVGSVLEVGTGVGDLLSIFGKSGWKSVGVEPSDKAREMANLNNNIKVYSQLSQVEENDFDVIMMWHVLEHIPDLNDIIKNLKSKLSDKGILVIALPNPNSWDAKYYKEYWGAWDVPRHLFHFTQQSVNDLFGKHGFINVKTSPMVFDSFYVSMLSEKYKGKKGISIFFRMLYYGLKSNISAWKTGEFSSMIYVFKLK